MQSARTAPALAALNGQELRRIEIRNGAVAAQELLLQMIGRIRDVQPLDTGPFRPDWT